MKHKPTQEMCDQAEGHHVGPTSRSDSALQKARETAQAEAYQEMDELKRVAEALHQNENNYRILFDHTPDAIFIHDMTGRILVANLQATEHYGCTPEEFTAMTASQVDTEDQSAHILERIEQLKQQGRIQFESEHRRKDGTVFPVEVHAHLCEWNGHPAVMSVCRDISAKKKSVAARQQAENIINNIQIGLYVYHLEDINDDRTLRMVYANPAAEQLTGGIRNCDLIGKMLDECFPSLRAMNVPQRYAEVVRTQKAAVFEDIHDRDGQLMNAAYVVKAFPLPDNHVGVSFDNITDRKRTEEALRDMNERLEQTTCHALELAERAEAATVAKSQFLANISHELRTPLNGSLGMAQVLKDTPLTEDQHELLDIVITSGKTLKHLINSLLDFEKMESKTFHLTERIFDVRAALVECFEEMSALAAAKRLALNFEVAPEISTHYVGDASHVASIIRLLTENAIKFTERGSVSVNISLERDMPTHSILNVVVSDTGIGIPAGLIEKIFDKFYQVDGSSTRRFGGMGIGLCLVKELVRLMGGEIEVSSQVGQGSRFHVTLCLKKPETSQAPGVIGKGGIQATSLEKRDTHKLTGMFKSRHARVLVVEDDRTSQQVALGMLDKMGLCADVVANGAEALKALEKTSYDLVLLDIQMPVMGGMDAARFIRNPRTRVINHAVPLIALTAHLDAGDRSQCLEAGMNDLILKPLEPHTLAVALEQWLPSPSASAGDIRVDL